MMVPIKIEKRSRVREEREINSSPRKSRSTMIKASIILISLAVIFLAVALISTKTSIFSKNNPRQAILTSTGIMYFGYVQNRSADMIKIKDAYYLTNLDNLTKAKAEDKISLIKMGSEVYKPSSQVYLNREHIIFIQDLNDESQINTAILSSKQK